MAHRNLREFVKKILPVFFLLTTTAFVTPAGPVYDFDGDGKADVAMWKFGGDWYWIRSSDGLLDGAGRFGTFATDMGAPGDYDGDGKNDPAVFRRSNTVIAGTQFYFYVLQSRDGFMALPWGRVPDTYPVSKRFRKPNGFPFPPGRSLTGKSDVPRLVKKGRY